MKELIRYFIGRVNRDEIGLEASALAFTTILSFIPALTIVVSIFAVVPAFAELRESLQGFAAENFMPVFTDSVSESVSGFVASARKMTLTGSLALMVVALMLIRSIDRTINRIWRGGKRRRTITFAIYWTLLTVGPLAFAAVDWQTNKLMTASIFKNDLGPAISFLYFIMPILIEMAAIWVIFVIVPVAVVKVRDALLGALVVTVAFELSKRIFSAFIVNFSSYEAIYGAVAAIPVLMMWVFIDWWIVLVGAEFTAVLGLARAGRGCEVPQLINQLANLTGSTQGSSRAIKIRRPSVQVKITRRSDPQRDRDLPS